MTVAEAAAAVVHLHTATGYAWHTGRAVNPALFGRLREVLTTIADGFLAGDPCGESARSIAYSLSVIARSDEDASNSIRERMAGYWHSRLGDLIAEMLLAYARAEGVK